MTLKCGHIYGLHSIVVVNVLAIKVPTEHIGHKMIAYAYSQHIDCIYTATAILKIF